MIKITESKSGVSAQEVVVAKVLISGQIYYLNLGVKIKHQ